MVAALLLVRVYQRSGEQIYRAIAGGLGAGLIAHFVFSMTDVIPLGAKVGVLEDGGKEAQRALELMQRESAKPEAVTAQQKLVDWWTSSAGPAAATDKPLVEEAGLFGGRQALKLTAFVPATMFICYSLLLGWFATRGGYKARGMH